MPLNIPKGILKSKAERVIVALTVLFAGIVVAFYAWGITTMATGFDKVVNAAPFESSIPFFNLKQAQTIDLRGHAVP